MANAKRTMTFCEEATEETELQMHKSKYQSLFLQQQKYNNSFSTE